MGKKYNEITNQAAAVRTQNRTLSFYINIGAVPIERFMELVEGKVKIFLLDFSDGKGDNAVKSYFNLDFPEVKYLYEKAKAFRMERPFHQTKIFGKYPEKDGKFKGSCFTQRISIQWMPKTPGGELMRNPWKIAIENGYAQAFQRKTGSFCEKDNSFVKSAGGEIFLSDIDFLNCFDKCVRFIDEYERLFADTLIPKGFQRLAEKRGAYVSNLQPVQETLPMRKMKIVINTDFRACKGEFVAGCLMGNGEYEIYFREVSEQLMDAQRSKQAIIVNLYQDDRRNIRFHSIAS